MQEQPSANGPSHSHSHSDASAQYRATDGSVSPPLSSGSSSPVGRIAPMAICEIEGLNGAKRLAKLIHLDSANSAAHLLVDGTRSALTLNFSQFACLRLDEWLPMGELDAAQAFNYVVCLSNSRRLRGIALVQQDADHGLYFFEPTATEGTMRRCFVPRAAYKAVEVRSASTHFSATQTFGPEASAAANADANQAPVDTTQRLSSFDRRSEHSSPVFDNRVPEAQGPQASANNAASALQHLQQLMREAHAQGVAAALIARSRRTAAAAQPQSGEEPPQGKS